MMIETHRLRCEPLSASHADAMYPLLKNEQIYTYLPEEPPNSVEELRSRYKFLAAGKSPDGAEHWLNWILFLRRTGEPIGFFQATVRPPDCSFAYVLNPAFWRHGYATEASIALRLIANRAARRSAPATTSAKHASPRPCPAARAMQRSACSSCKPACAAAPSAAPACRRSICSATCCSSAPRRPTCRCRISRALAC